MPSLLEDYLTRGKSPFWDEPYESIPAQDWWLTQEEEEYRQRKGLTIECIGDVLAIRMLSGIERRKQKAL